MDHIASHIVNELCYGMLARAVGAQSVYEEWCLLGCYAVWLL
jgi:hypothetical protein